MHAKCHAGALEVMHVEHLLRAAIGGGVAQRDLAGTGDAGFGRAVDVAIGMAADHDGLCPVRDKARHVGADDRFTEDRAIKDIADGPVGRAPHLLEAKFFYPCLVWGDGGAFHAHAVPAHGFGGFHGYAVIGLVTVGNAKVIIFQVDIQIGQDQPFADEVQIMRVISSPSISTTGFLTLIFAMVRLSAFMISIF